PVSSGLSGSALSLPPTSRRNRHTMELTMRLPLAVACLIAGSTWTFASAQLPRPRDNPKTAPKQGHMKAQTPKSKRAGQATSAGGSLPAAPQHHAMLAPSNDDCSGAIAIAGSGPFAFDTSSASTSAE